MKKLRILAITLIISFSLMGAGYAYWTDTLTINNTITTGELDVVFGCLSSSDYDTYLKSGEGIAFSKSNDDYVETSVSQEEKELIFRSSNLYPGSGAWLKFKIVNNGTIPAKIDSITGTVLKGEELKDMFRYTIASVSVNRVEQNGRFKTITEETIYANDTPATTFNDFINQLNSLLKTDASGNPILLEPGDYLVINGAGDTLDAGFDIYMPTTVKEYINNGATPTENQEYSFKLNLNFTQHNAQ